MGKYREQHRNVEFLRGRPRFCEGCGKDGHEPPDYYEGGPEFEWANLTGKYDSPQDYIRLCVSCHREHDARKRHDDANDHAYDPIPNGKWTTCSICRKRTEKKYYRKKRNSLEEGVD